ncbi:class I SAM-dependent DNA methyltransferase [Gimesia aquarii]|uniref:Trans-aconitate 2-methyltransferase n=1 Tax=Gimesia aquarii TaxID=2527964 RepID=A0A517WP44_9PLAN|nr:class I SAM-dependent methyltransferase [Gimesia aquarii]QDU07031.1 Trans-aconitate 2-methyltransferase [Gimesia aquarii]
MEEHTNPQSQNQQDADTDHATRDRELFDQIAEKYCRKDLLTATRHARRHRLFQTLRSIPMSPKADVLEVGCGAGFSAKYLEGRVGSYCGVDYSENLIHYACVHNSGPEIEFVAANIKDFQPGKSFDLIFAIGLLHHFDDLDSMLKSTVQLLKPGGWFIANEPQPGNPLVSVARRIRKRIDTHYSAEQKELTARSLQDACERANLSSVQILPQGLFSTPFAEVPLSPQWLSTPFSYLACFTDKIVERLPAIALRKLTWNLIVAGQKPEAEC